MDTKDDGEVPGKMSGVDNSNYHVTSYIINYLPQASTYPVTHRTINRHSTEIF